MSKPQITRTSPFNLGDKVKVKTPYSNLQGEIGKIIVINSCYCQRYYPYVVDFGNGFLDKFGEDELERVG
jgi:hypothetical protein